MARVAHPKQCLIIRPASLHVALYPNRPAANPQQNVVIGAMGCGYHRQPILAGARPSRRARSCPWRHRRSRQSARPAARMPCHETDEYGAWTPFYSTGLGSLSLIDANARVSRCRGSYGRTSPQRSSCFGTDFQSSSVRLTTALSGRAGLWYSRI
jgi:hypothetical protein